MSVFNLTLLHSERLKLYASLVFLSATGLKSFVQKILFILRKSDCHPLKEKKICYLLSNMFYVNKLPIVCVTACFSSRLAVTSSITAQETE